MYEISHCNQNLLHFHHTSLSDQLLLVTCKQRADHFTSMMWFDFTRWLYHFIEGRSHHSDCIKYSQNDMIQNYILSETDNWCMYATCEIEPKNFGFTQMTSRGAAEGQIILLVLARVCFSWNNQWLLYSGPFSGCLRQDGKGQQYITVPIWKCMSGIGVHRFTFLIDFLSNYAFYTNLTSLSIGWLLNIMCQAW